MLSTRTAPQYSLQTVCRDARPWRLTSWKVIGYMLGKRWSIGAKIDYLTASNAKKKDARNKNTYMNLKCTREWFTVPNT